MDATQSTDDEHHAQASVILANRTTRTQYLIAKVKPNLVESFEAMLNHFTTYVPSADDPKGQGKEAVMRIKQRLLLLLLKIISTDAADPGFNNETFSLEEWQEMLRVMESLEALSLDSAEDTTHWGWIRQCVMGKIVRLLNRRYLRSENPENLDLAIYHGYRALQLESGESPSPDLSATIGGLFVRRFENLGNLEDLTRGIECLERAIALAPHCHPQKRNYFEILSGSYWLRYQHAGGLEALETSIDYLERAVLITPDDHPEKLEQLTSLSSLLGLLFRYTGSSEPTNRMILCRQQALALTPEGHHDRPVRLMHLSESYWTRSMHLGRLDDLDKSAYYAEQAALLTPDGHQDKHRQLSHLGHSYHMLFHHLGRMADLEKAIGYLEEAFCMTVDGNPNRFAYLLDLSSLYDYRFAHTRGLDDQKKAIDCLKQAVSWAPSSLPEDIYQLFKLGYCYLVLFSHSDSSQYFNNAVTLLKQAVRLTSDDHQSRSCVLSTLGAVYLTWFQKFGGLESLVQSIEYLEQSISLSSVISITLNAPLTLLGEAYHHKFRSSGLLQDAQSAMAYSQRAATAPTGRPKSKLGSARIWAMCAMLSDNVPLEGYAHAMALLPQVVWLGSSIQLRYKHISSEVGSLVTEAAAVAVACDRNDLALEWLEQGRSIVWTQMLDLRSPLDELYVAHPKVAEELECVCAHLERASMPGPFGLAHMGSQISQLEADLAHRRAAERREWLIEHIRRLYGFEDFLRPPSSSKLVDMLQGRIAVVVNTFESEYSVALVVQSRTKTITRVLLPSFSTQKAENARSYLRSYLQKGGVRRGFKIGDSTEKMKLVGTLSMLWYGVVQPILAHLNITRVLPADSEELPHITWCTTGALSSLPIHAAGDYSDPSTVLPNLAISSYSPTLTALGRSISASSTFSGILAVGHASSVRGLSALPGTKAELDEVQVLARGQLFTRLDEDKACADVVLQAMESHSWVHFACHGSQNPYDPLKSALHLHDKQLDLATIAQHPLNNKQLAILSACQTATGDSTLPDESLHLAAGLLMAGYPAVIATMWSIHDQDAPLITKKVYECLLEGGVPDSRKAAKALHRAVASLRETVGVEQYGRWMPY
ncbi:hypothetical protein FRC07_006797, partial [Ceratobasidium sp. 392]